MRPTEILTYDFVFPITGTTSAGQPVDVAEVEGRATIKVYASDDWIADRAGLELLIGNGEYAACPDWLASQIIVWLHSDRTERAEIEAQIIETVHATWERSRERELV